MERFADLMDDFAVSDAAEQAAAIAKLLPHLQEKLKLLQAALDDIARRDLEVEAVQEGSFGYIPLDIAEFLSCIYSLEEALTADVDYRHSELRHRPCTFLEVGCGPGRNLQLLRATDRFCFHKIQGFDISEAMVATGRQRYGLGADIFVADCLEFDYTGYDVVYFYRPMSDDDQERRFEDRLVEQLKSGGYIVCYGSVALDDDRRLIQKDTVGRLWKKI